MLKDTFLTLLEEDHQFRNELVQLLNRSSKDRDMGIKYLDYRFSKSTNEAGVEEKFSTIVIRKAIEEFHLFFISNFVEKFEKRNCLILLLLYRKAYKFLFNDLTLEQAKCFAFGE
jgi:hypothetical protein